MEKEYKIVNRGISARRTENLVNSLSFQGWEIKFFGESSILLERNRK